jgi:hypothetical protein
MHGSGCRHFCQPGLPCLRSFIICPRIEAYTPLAVVCAPARDLRVSNALKWAYWVHWNDCLWSLIEAWQCHNLDSSDTLQGVEKSFAPPLLAIYLLGGPARVNLLIAKHFVPRPGTLLPPCHGLKSLCQVSSAGLFRLNSVTSEIWHWFIRAGRDHAGLDNALLARNYVRLTITSYLTLSGLQTGVSAENGRVKLFGTRCREYINWYCIYNIDLHMS